MKFGTYVGLAVCLLILAASFASPALAQGRSRIVSTTFSRPINKPTTSTPPVVKTLSSSRPILSNEPVVQKPLVEKTGSSSPANLLTALAGKALNYNTSVSGLMMNAINARLGIRYRYGSEGPNAYDCSGFVWSVFQAAGFNFERTSAANFWNEFEPVTGDDRYKFGTLVFFNDLGHVGIVVDKDGFYQSSSSKGITYSKFEGYWEKRITGFRRVPMAQLPQTLAPAASTVVSATK